MRLCALFILSGSLIVLLVGCKREEPTKGPEYLMTSTVREIMGSMVMPSADALWNAVSSTVTDKGTIDKVPTTELEWKDVRSKAITIMEASDLILIPGRHVAAPGQTAQDPKVNLAPEQIQKMIADDPASWTKFAHAMHESVVPALKAIDAKDSTALSDAGEGIDKACENCHLKFWYPGDAKK